MRARTLCLTALVAVLGAAAAHAHAQAPPPLSITFEATGVVVHDATAGGGVVFYAMEQEATPYRPTIRHLEGTIIASAAGEAQWSMPNGVTPRAVWAAVDAVSGRFAVAAPNPADLHPFTLPPTAERRDQQGNLVAFRVSAQFLDVLLVRPATGQWHVRRVDGGPGDDDSSTDGGVNASFTSTADLGGKGQAPPATIQNGDILIAMEPFAFRYMAMKVGN